MNTALMFSTGKDEWQTPPDLFARLNDEFHFTLDAAASLHNHQCPKWLGPDHPDPERRDGLAYDWCLDGGPVFLNPPYSRGLQRKFIELASVSAQLQGLTVVMLLPARTDTKAFHTHIWAACAHRPQTGVEVRFLPGRLRFVGASAGAPFPSMIVVFRA